MAPTLKWWDWGGGGGAHGFCLANKISHKLYEIQSYLIRGNLKILRELCPLFKKEYSFLDKGMVGGTNLIQYFRVGKYVEAKKMRTISIALKDYYKSNIDL